MLILKFQKSMSIMFQTSINHDYNTNNIALRAGKKFESQLKTVLFNSHSIPDLEVSAVS